MQDDVKGNIEEGIVCCDTKAVKTEGKGRTADCMLMVEMSMVVYMAQFMSCHLVQYVWLTLRNRQR